VAAPFYFNKAEGGAVYIYTTLDLCRTVNDKCSPVKLVGHEESRFIIKFTSCFIWMDIKYGNDKLTIGLDSH